MKDPPSYRVDELAARLGGTLRGPAVVEVSGVNTPGEAGDGDLTFLGTAAFAKLWPSCRAAAAVLTEAVLEQIDSADARPLLVVENTDVAMIQALELFQRPEIFPDEGVHPQAWVHPSARLGARVRVGPHVSVDRDVVIGDDVVLQPGVRLHAGVVVGEESILHANVVVRHECVIGARVIVHQNASIGADGFGYRPAPDGRGLMKMPHIGNVVIEDDVEIGANSCVDRGKFGSTVIGAGTKIDNICQVGHNVRLGRCCLLAAGSAIGGSAVFGDGVQLGGQVGVRDHVTIGAGARIAGGSVVYGDVPAGATWAGMPAADSAAVKRQWVALKRLPDLLRSFGGAKSPSR